MVIQIICEEPFSRAGVIYFQLLESFSGRQSEQRKQ